MKICIKEEDYRKVLDSYEKLIDTYGKQLEVVAKLEYGYKFKRDELKEQYFEFIKNNWHYATEEDREKFEEAKNFRISRQRRKKGGY